MRGQGHPPRIPYGLSTVRTAWPLVAGLGCRVVRPAVGFSREAATVRVAVKPPLGMLAPDTVAVSVTVPPGLPAGIETVCCAGVYVAVTPEGLLLYVATQRTTVCAELTAW